MKNNHSLLAHNTFGIDVQARFFAEYSTLDELKNIMTSYYNQQGNSAPVLHIGGGSNLLFLNDYEGLVLHSSNKGIKVLDEDAESVIIQVGAGMIWDELVEETLNRGWYGLENLSLIPGEVGASAVQNIGAYGSEVKDFIQRVHLFDLHTFKARIMTRQDMQYAYRYSILKSNDLRGRYAVTHVDYKLQKNFAPYLEYGGLKTMVQDVAQLDAFVLRNCIIELRQSKLPDTKILGNAGSFFMNPIVSRSIYETLQKEYPEMPHYEVDADHIKIPAGWLIEKSGWKGKSLGPAGVYERQALVLVNLGGAKGEDILRLCEAVRADVKIKFGIDIHPEVNFIS